MHLSLRYKLDLSNSGFPILSKLHCTSPYTMVLKASRCIEQDKKEITNIFLSNSSRMVSVLIFQSVESAYNNSSFCHGCGAAALDRIFKRLKKYNEALKQSKQVIVNRTHIWESFKEDDGVSKEKWYKNSRVEGARPLNAGQAQETRLETCYSFISISNRAS